MHNRLYAICLSFVFFSLSYLALKTASHDQPWFGHSAKVLQIQSDIQNYENALGYTVWSSGRQELYQKLLDSYQQHANLRPFHATQWPKILTLQTELGGTPKQQQLWMLERSIDFNKWNVDQHKNLAYFCVALNQQLSDSLLSKCRSIFLSLTKKNSVKQLAALLQVDELMLVKRFVSEEKAHNKER